MELLRWKLPSNKSETACDGLICLTGGVDYRGRCSKYERVPMILGHWTLRKCQKPAQMQTDESFCLFMAQMMRSGVCYGYTLVGQVRHL